MTEKHFEVQFDGWRYFHVTDIINERCIARLDTKGDADAFLEIIKDYEELIKENEELKKEKYQAPFLKIFKDYFIYYKDATFSMHKPKDIRGLCFLLNKEHGFTELQCEYNDEEMI